METHLGDAGFGGNFLIVQSTGGLFDVDDARRSCIRMLESGPAAGVVGTKVLCDSIGLANAIAFDMGGTTAKAGVIHEGNVLMTGSALIGGYATGLPVQMPMIDIQEVGTGGGSIARVEVGNALRVGPESAGAAPGPVCYGLGGTEPTITDANLILGRLGADRFLGGEMPLDLAAAKKALTEKVADAARARPDRGGRRHPAHRHHQDGPRGALGDHRARPRCGGLRARRLWRRRAAARRGGRARAFDRHRDHPARAGALLGLRHAGGGPAPRLRQHLVQAARRGFVRRHGSDLRRDGAAGPRDRRPRPERSRGVEVRRSADMRYVGQEHAVTVELPIELFKNEDRAGIKALFDAVHQTRYGFSVANEKAEIVSLRSAVIGQLRKPPFEHIAKGSAEPDAAAFRGKRPVYFASTGFVDTPTYDRPALKAGNRIAGPALIEEHASTTVVHPGDNVEVDAFGDLVITVRRG